MLTDAQLADAAAATYHNPATEQIADIYWCQGAVQEGTVVIAFRGSYSPENWIRNLRWKPILDPDLGWCHRGFVNGARLFLSKFTRTGDPVILTGHSLGGALALAVGGILAKGEARPPTEIVTFGAPRVGMNKFVAALEKVTVRQYRRGNDPVTQLPFAIWPLNFMHPRELLTLGAPSRNPASCHSADGYVVDLAAEAPSSFTASPQPTLERVQTVVINAEEELDA